MEGAVADFLVAAHVGDEAGGGEAAVEHVEAAGKAGAFEVVGDAEGVGFVAEAEAGGEAEGKAEADGDGFAVEDAAAIAVFGLEGVAEGVAEVEQGAAVGGASPRARRRRRRRL